MNPQKPSLIARIAKWILSGASALWIFLRLRSFAIATVAHGIVRRFSNPNSARLVLLVLAAIAAFVAWYLASFVGEVLIIALAVELVWLWNDLVNKIEARKAN